MASDGPLLNGKGLQLVSIRAAERGDHGLDLRAVQPRAPDARIAVIHEVIAV